MCNKIFIKELFYRIAYILIDTRVEGLQKIHRLEWQTRWKILEKEQDYNEDNHSYRCSFLVEDFSFSHLQSNCNYCKYMDEKEEVVRLERHDLHLPCLTNVYQSWSWFQRVQICSVPCNNIRNDLPKLKLLFRQLYLNLTDCHKRSVWRKFLSSDVILTYRHCIKLVFFYGAFTYTINEWGFYVTV